MHLFYPSCHYCRNIKLVTRTELSLTNKNNTIQIGIISFLLWEIMQRNLMMDNLFPKHECNSTYIMGAFKYYIRELPHSVQLTNLTEDRSCGIIICKVRPATHPASQPPFHLH